MSERDVRLAREPDGWSIEVPVVREEIAVSKRAVVRRHGEARAATELDDDVTQPLHSRPATGTLRPTGMEQDPLE